MKDFASCTPATKDAEPATGKGAALVDNRASTVAQRKLQDAMAASPRQVAQRQAAPAPRPNRTGLPDKLKAGVESLSGHSLDDVKVHYNSSKPAQLQAHAYAQGTDIHLGPGQEKHLPHEAWHVVQQKQGRVRATRQLKGVGVNDDSGLEREADIKSMNATKLSSVSSSVMRRNVSKLLDNKIHQLQCIVQFDTGNGEPAKKKQKKTHEPTNIGNTGATVAVVSSSDPDAEMSDPAHSIPGPTASAKGPSRRPILVNKVARHPIMAVVSSSDPDAEMSDPAHSIPGPTASAKGPSRRPPSTARRNFARRPIAASPAISYAESDDEMPLLPSSVSPPVASSRVQLRPPSTARRNFARELAASPTVSYVESGRKRKRSSSALSAAELGHVSSTALSDDDAETSADASQIDDNIQSTTTRQAKPKQNISTAAETEAGERPITLKSMDETLKAARKGNRWDRATKHPSSGNWSNKVNVRGKKSFDKQRVWQVLRHISTVIYHYVKTKMPDEQEVQAMLVGERLYISSNSAQSMLSLGELDSEGLFNMFLNGNYIPNKDRRALGDIKKLKMLIGGSRIEDMRVSEGEKIQLNAVSEMVKSAIKDPKKYIAVKSLSDNIFKGPKNQIVAITGLDKIHAEQNLIIAYYKSGISEPAMIYGKKRPCTGCYLTFKFATEVLGLKLTYNVNPGGAWGPAERGLVKLMQERGTSLSEVQKFVDDHLPKKTYRTAVAGKKGDTTKSCHDCKQEDTGYDTASDSGSDYSDIDVRKDDYVGSSSKPAAASK